MGGFGGFGSTGGETSSTANLNNIFSYGIPTAQQSQATGTSNLGTASNFFNNLLTAGRTQTTASSAPAINAALAGSDASKRQQATSGTGRTGGTAELNREQGAATEGNIDSIISQNLLGGQQAGAQGLTNIGQTQLSQVAPLLGLGASTQNDILSANVTKGGQQSNTITDLLTALL